MNAGHMLMLDRKQMIDGPNFSIYILLLHHNKGKIKHVRTRIRKPTRYMTTFFSSLHADLLLLLHTDIKETDTTQHNTTQLAEKHKFHGSYLYMSYLII